MCYAAPGPRCSAHTRANLVKARADLDAATANEAEIDPTNMEARRVALENKNAAQSAFRKAVDDYNASPEGIERNRERSTTMWLPEEERDKARGLVMEGEATRKRQQEAFAFNKELEGHATARIHTSYTPSLDGMTGSGVKNSASSSTDPKMLHYLAKQPNFVEPSGYESITVDDYKEVRERILGNKNASASTVKFIANDLDKRDAHNSHTLATIAGHPNASAESIESAYEKSGEKDPLVKEWVALKVASNANTSPKLLVRIAKDAKDMNTQDIDGALLANPNLSAAARAKIIAARKAKVAK